MKCNNDFFRKVNTYKIKNNQIFVDGKLYGDLISFDEESGVFECCIISENQFLDGQHQIGIIIMKDTIQCYINN